MPAIRVNYDPPPIPLRAFDWRATRDGYEPPDPIGYGRTADEAIAALLDAEADRD